MKSLMLIASFSFLLCPALSLAEYRVFVLKISESEKNFRLVQSTLDPQQYGQYFTVKNTETITYIDTWRCYGRTDDFAPHCPNPKGQIPPVTPPAP